MVFILVFHRNLGDSYRHISTGSELYLNLIAVCKVLVEGNFSQRIVMVDRVKIIAHFFCRSDIAEPFATHVHKGYSINVHLHLLHLSPLLRNVGHINIDQYSGVSV